MGLLQLSLAQTELSRLHPLPSPLALTQGQLELELGSGGGC